MVNNRTQSERRTMPVKALIQMNPHEVPKPARAASGRERRGPRPPGMPQPQQKMDQSDRNSFQGISGTGISMITKGYG